MHSLQNVPTIFGTKFSSGRILFLTTAKCPFNIRKALGKEIRNPKALRF